ncbi:hypothetical protein GGU10DRAFT_380302 [Lentinula aff. detonsa]|uniref:Uncharacterized protein n=1 Tax=Lentinula aff. detonsa TaxID=2804958 RepID=A0AA38KNF7_9AGAR|nr:hypothetical protein GGU10DRAFT_380302 [Lentinula aff. detonsa]
MATKTRGMTQTSTINNARTRAGKRKAGNAGTRQQQMNSVTSARTRNQKKKQINKHSRASTPIASSPASVAHSAQSPSVAGLAAEELALNENLKKGWGVLKSYLDNEASADDVHDILQRVNDPELDQAFAEIMGCEPDEHSRHNNLYEKVGKKFLELENTADVVEENPKAKTKKTTKAKTKKTTKAKTTFRPAFPGRENPVSDSMSRAPMNHPPPPPHSTSAISTIPTPITLIHTRRQSPVTTMSEDKLFDDTESEGAGKTKGRLSKAVKAEAFAIRQHYHDELEALAKKSGKNLSTLLEAIGDIVPNTRALNSWNAYQSYAVNPDGLGLVRQENQSEAEFTADIRDRYVKLRNRESEPSDLNLDGILEWYRKEILEETAEQRAGGYTKKEIEKLCGAFINRGRQLYEARQLCSIGWLVDPVSALAVPWGADPLYVAMRDANPAQVTAQAVDYGTMFHSQLMLQKQGGLGLDPVKQGLVNRFVDDGTDKVVLRGLLKDVLLLSLREIRPNKDFKQMKWGSAFADLCYKEKVKLINYPVGMKPIGPPGGIRGSSLIPLKYVKVIVKQHIHFWQQELREYKTEARRTKHAEDDSENGDSDNGDDKDKDKQAKIFEEDLVQFVLWDDDEKELSLKEQANVGILLQEPRGDNNPVVLAKVLHSKIFLKQAVAHNISIELPDGMQEEDEEEMIDEGQDGEGENKGEGEDNGVEEDKSKGEDDQGGEDGSEGEDNGEGKERPKKQVWAGKTDQSKKRKQSDI